MHSKPQGAKGERRSISFHYAQVVYDAAQRAGLDAERLIQSAGLDPSLLHKDYSAVRGLRITPQQFAQLLLGLWQGADDEFMGMANGACKHGTFSLMARQAVNQQDLRGVYRHISRFYRLFTDAFELVLEECEDEAIFSMRLSAPELDRHHCFTEFFLLLWHRFPGWLTGRFLPLRQVSLAYAQPEHSREYRLIFPGDTIFNQKQTSLHFDRALLDEPIVQSEASLIDHLSRAPLVWLSKPVFYPHFTRQVLNLLQQQTDENALNMETVAEQLHLTSRTLRRKLTQEKTSFKDLKDKVRLEQAIQLLCHPDLSLSEISNRLNFSDPAAFSRAFKDWTGMPPSQYRGQKNI